MNVWFLFFVFLALGSSTFCIFVLENSFKDLVLTCHYYLAGGSWCYRPGTEGPG